MKIKIYTIFTCASCVEYVNRLSKISKDAGYTCEIYDIDHDPILSVEYLKEHRECTNSIPFFVIYKEGYKKCCYSNILDDSTLRTILHENAEN